MMTFEIAKTVDKEICLNILSEAFLNEPGMIWLCGRGLEKKRSWFSATWDLLSAQGLENIVLARKEGKIVGVALTSPAVGKPPIVAQLKWIFNGVKNCGFSTIFKTFCYLNLTTSWKPLDYWTLEFIAIAPVAQGQGVASKLIGELQDRLTSKVYLTTADERNVPIYEKLKFHVIKKIHFAGLSIIVFTK